VLIATFSFRRTISETTIAGSPRKTVGQREEGRKRLRLSRSAGRRANETQTAGPGTGTPVRRGPIVNPLLGRGSAAGGQGVGAPPPAPRGVPGGPRPTHRIYPRGLGQRRRSRAAAHSFAGGSEPCCGHRVQPGRQLTNRIAPNQRAVCFDQRVLDDVLGIRAADQARAVAHQRSAIP
jgi:hypothetical protein